MISEENPVSNAYFESFRQPLLLGGTEATEHLPLFRLLKVGICFTFAFHMLHFAEILSLDLLLAAMGDIVQCQLL